jgi:uncharacterized protein YndB with AHSA1/START domain/DNA-binding transcriptional ArsR family regulator
MDAVFKALADPSRRELLDRLNARNGLTLGELCDGLGMARQSVTKHLAVLEAANVVTTARRGREKLHYLNAAPINDIADRWINRYDRARAEALADLKHALEDRTMTTTEFVYTTYIKSPPDQVWKALTEPAFTRRYWGAVLHSDWQVGSKVLWEEFGLPPRDLNQVILESDPPRRLAYTWHTFQPEHAELFGLTPERLAELQRERRSQVAFDLEPVGDTVKLTVTHDHFDPGSEMLRAISGGWPGILASLKTLLETGDVLHIDVPAQ